MTIAWNNPGVGYGPGREGVGGPQSRGWNETIAAQPNPPPVQPLLPLATGPRRVMQHVSDNAGVLQLQFVGAEAPPLSPAVEVEISQGVDTGATRFRTYVGRIGIAVPVSAGLTLCDVVRTRGVAGTIVAQFRPGFTSRLNLTFYEQVAVAAQVELPIPLGAASYELELPSATGLTITVGKSINVLAGPGTFAGILPNDARLLVTNTGPNVADVIVRFEGNC